MKTGKNKTKKWKIEGGKGAERGRKGGGKGAEEDQNRIKLN